MAVGKNKMRIAVCLQKEVVKVIDDIVKASPQPLTRSNVIEFAIAEFYLSILESTEKGKEKES